MQLVPCLPMAKGSEMQQMTFLPSPATHSFPHFLCLSIPLPFFLMLCGLCLIPEILRADLWTLAPWLLGRSKTESWEL